ncbi:MAG: hypothetical protein SPJ07_01700 [Bacilli bacterium]|nr:hypothetical protein [Bacilli bacterium]
MNDKKERVYSEEDLCEYTILQKIDELEKRLKNIKNEFNDLYETKEAANAIHVKLRQSDAKINNSINALNEITPTDVGIKDNKLGLLHDTTWLTNQNAINLDGFTYDEATKTLKAEGSGATLPAGTGTDPFHINGLEYYSGSDYSFSYSVTNTTYLNISFSPTGTSGLNIELQSRETEASLPLKIYLHGGYNSTGLKLEAGGINFKKTPYGQFRIYNYNKYNGDMFIPVLEHPSTDGKYLLQITRNNEYSYHYDWVAGGGYNHYIVITDGTASNAIYLLIPSTNNLICNILTDLDALLGTEPRFIQASGVITDTASKLPIVAIKWQGSFSSSKIITMSSEEAITKFTDIVDVVIPA